MFAIKPILMVGMGGATGAVIRYLCSNLIDSAKYPYATFLVNVLGCFLMGILLGLSVQQNRITKEFWLFTATGFCGGFTTFSAFSVENFQMILDGKFSLSIFYILSSIISCIGATWIGYKLFTAL